MNKKSAADAAPTAVPSLCPEAAFAVLSAYAKERRLKVVGSGEVHTEDANYRVLDEETHWRVVRQAPTVAIGFNRERQAKAQARQSTIMATLKTLRRGQSQQILDEGQLAMLDQFEAESADLERELAEVAEEQERLALETEVLVPKGLSGVTLEVA